MHSCMLHGPDPRHDNVVTALLGRGLGEHRSCPLSGKGNAVCSDRLAGLENHLTESSGRVGGAQLHCGIGGAPVLQDPERVSRSLSHRPPFSTMFLLFSWFISVPRSNLTFLL